MYKKHQHKKYIIPGISLSEDPLQSLWTEIDFASKK